MVHASGKYEIKDSKVALVYLAAVVELFKNCSSLALSGTITLLLDFSILCCTSFRPMVTTFDYHCTVNLQLDP